MIKIHKDYREQLREYSKSVLIAVHIPKTAGTSFRKAAELYYGFDNVAYDYPNKDISIPVLFRWRKEKSDFSAHQVFDWLLEKRPVFITGHFGALKYLNFLPDAKCIAFFRDPFQRVISEYLHFKRHYNYINNFETFIEKSVVQNVQYNFLKGIALEDFFFIGLTENYPRSLEIINQKLGTSFKLFRENRNRKNVSLPYSDSNFECIRTKFSNLNQKDLAIHEKLLQMWKTQR